MALLGAGSSPARGADVAPVRERLDGDVYVDADYRIRIGRPPGWSFVPARAVVERARRLAGVAGPGGDPVQAAGFAVIVVKGAGLGRTFEPQVVVRVARWAETGADLARACPALPTGLGEVELVGAVRPAAVDGRPAARLDVRATVDEEAVRATALCTVREGRAFLVVAQALAGEFEREAAAFESILASFRLQ